MATADRIARRGWATRGRQRRNISSVPYLRGLDGMRALAVIAVMVYHANNSWLPGGFIGVEVFFVISGYLITLLLIGEHERSGRVHLGHFYMRRARRLLPALFMTLAMVSVYTALFKREELGRLRGDVLAALTYVSNWYQIWVDEGYTAEGQFAPLRHLWSLAVEEQFYLVWPIVMIALIRVGKGRLPSYSRWLLLAAVAISVAVGLLFYPGRAIDPATTPNAFWEIGGNAVDRIETLYLSTITRSTGLLVGAALAMLWRPVAVMRGPLRNKGHVLDGLALVALGSLLVLAWRLTIVTDQGGDPLLFRGGFLAVDLAAMLMIAAVSHRRSITGRLLGMPLLLWIGTRSYGMYLFHWPIFQMIRGVAGNPLDVSEFAVAMAATAVVTELSYRLFEMPIRRRRIRPIIVRLGRRAGPIGRRAIGFGAAGSVALVGFASASMVTAELEPNDIERSLQQGEDAVIDLAGAPELPGVLVPVTSEVVVMTELEATTSTVTQSTEPPESTELVETVDVATTELVETTDVTTTEPVETTDVATTELVETTDVTTTEPVETTDVAMTELVETTDVTTTEPVDSTDVATTDAPFLATNPLPQSERRRFDAATADVETTETTTSEAPDTTEAPETTASSTTTASTTTIAPTTTVAATAAPTTTAPPPTTTAAPTTTTQAPTTTARPPVVIAIGDSVMLGAAENLAARGVVVDAAVSRQMIDYVPIVQQLAAEGKLGDVVVVHLGTNGPFSEETMTAFFNALVGVPRVVVLTVHAERGYTARNNELILSLPARYPNVSLIDWNAAVGGCPGDCLYDDGIHLPPDGRRYYAQLIFDQIGI